MTAYGTTMTAGYRPDGLRAWRQYPGEDKKFFLYDNGNVVCEIGPNGGVTASNVFAPDGLVGRAGGMGEFLNSERSGVAWLARAPVPSS